MDVKHVLFVDLPASTRWEVYEYIKTHRKDSTALSRWEAMDKWFWDNYKATRREPGGSWWTFSDPEKYTEFCLKWM